MKGGKVISITSAIIIVALLIGVLIFFSLKYDVLLSPQAKQKSKLVGNPNNIVGASLKGPSGGEWQGNTGAVYYPKEDLFLTGSLPLYIIERTAPSVNNKKTDKVQYVLDVRQNARVWALIDKKATCINPEIKKLFPNVDFEAKSLSGRVYTAYYGDLNTGEYTIPLRTKGCESKTKNAPRYNYVFVATDAGRIITPPYGNPTPKPTTPGYPTPTPITPNPNTGNKACGTETSTGGTTLQASCSVGVCPNTEDGEKQVCVADYGATSCKCIEETAGVGTN